MRLFEVPVPQLELVVALSVDVSAPVDGGTTGFGTRRIIPITGGRAEGPAFSGTILPGGSDVQLLRPDGVTEIAARYLIATDRGTRVFVENTGVRHAPPEITRRMAAGEAFDPREVYFRSVPRFETDDAGLRWLERDQFLATGARLPDSVRIDVYRVA